MGSWDAEILINATSVGMAPNDKSSPVAPEVLGGFKTVMDIVYSPLQTRLLREAAAAGCICINGLEMLLYQGGRSIRAMDGITTTCCSYASRH